MLEVTTVYFDDLTEDEKGQQPNNGSGKEYAGYLKVTHGGNVIGIHSDAMEPEDCTFGRDLSWVEDAIKTAYELGKGDA
jgi:hypothetical protein